jgi:hypothetical protein
LSDIPIEDRKSYRLSDLCSLDGQTVPNGKLTPMPAMKASRWQLVMSSILLAAWTVFLLTMAIHG